MVTGSNMIWYEKYLGIPFAHNHFSFDACDCGGLVLLVYKNEHIADLPRLNNCVKFNNKEKHKAIFDYVDYFEQVEKYRIQEFDVFIQLVSNNIIHCGLIVDSEQVLHAIQDGSVKLENNRRVFNNSTQFYRLKNEYRIKSN